MSFFLHPPSILLRDIPGEMLALHYSDSEYVWRRQTALSYGQNKNKYYEASVGEHLLILKSAALTAFVHYSSHNRDKQLNLIRRYIYH